MTPRQRLNVFRRTVERHPRLWGLLFAGLLFVSYLVAIRPAREVFAQHVAYPVFAAIDTPRSRAFDVVQPERRAEAVFVLPRGEELDPNIEGIVWAAPAGIIFLLPAMFLIVAFPTRPYWLYLLAYHAVLGLGTVALFALAIGWFASFFDVHEFARTYVSEGVSLTVPLLLFLAGKAQEIRAEDGQAVGSGQ
ncbi:hypothetical protein [Rubricoccus marinus]|uniref:Uncharacterized protein n=1 Tax=Rubricoccus marinus TaxID=716817 RepID=A0A259TY13_9BACT|nr:hypothetical protein [Rubricoccus marinus]OZC02468.1 hypothetical protein BSZ36_05430 [Rubricoccus marinus]